jgi:DNA invertase Pin-like site-specific DNA recombinase
MARSSSSADAPPGKRLRCAVYTRKSSEEGLEQDFNSLDAQREACEAFILSQKREGWLLIRELYDDGGYSGGTLERPAFQRLLADVRANRVDVVVVYKVDRLTRSLSDFAKIVEAFDKHGVSFVSVTQQFNTTSSMGRLTLNILLSFAQFEREVTGERIRDKIAASKKKGLWMGGQPPLGYDVNERKLTVNAAEAKTVRSIFRRYLDLKSVRLLKADLDAQGIVSKHRKAADGSPYGGKPIARGALYLMLQNRIYRGEIVHKHKAYPGEHAPIVDEPLWDKVQAILQENRVDREQGDAASEPSLLTGRIFDARGNRMSPVHANKKGVRYRYYVSRQLQDGSADAKGRGQRIPAQALEGLILRKIRQQLNDLAFVIGCVTSDRPLNALVQKRVIERARTLADGNDNDATPCDFRTLTRSILGRVQVHADRIDLAVHRDRLSEWLKDDTNKKSTNEQPAASFSDNTPIILSIPAHLKRAGKEMRIIVRDGSDPAIPDTSLVRLLVRAHAIRQRLIADRSLTLDEISKSEGVVPSYATRLYRLTLLAPDIVTAILAGRHPPELTARRLMDDTRLPLAWQEQRQTLGFSIS